MYKTSSTTYPPPHNIQTDRHSPHLENCLVFLCKDNFSRKRDNFNDRSINERDSTYSGCAIYVFLAKFFESVFKRSYFGHVQYFIFLICMRARVAFYVYYIVDFYTTI